MIQVTLDKEMVKRFRRKVINYISYPFAPDSVIYKHPRFNYWTYDAFELLVFQPAGIGNRINEYDREFTEWLEINRPEVFL